MVHLGDLAVPTGVDTTELSRSLAHAHDEFVDRGVTHPRLRSIVSQSWKRSLKAGLDPESVTASIRIEADRLQWLQQTHPLAAGMPVIRSLLVDDATECGLLVAVSDAAGHLLWVEGDPTMRARAEGMHFLAGADWSEASVGTNAPGTALALDRPVQIFESEHLARMVTPWSCSAAPIHDPHTGEILGVLDVTGGGEVARPHALALVRAAAAAVEAELKSQRAAGLALVSPAQGPVPAKFNVLGRHGADLVTPGGLSRLSQRHSEIALLLIESDDGYSAPELAVALSESEQAEVTVRAEMSRLRTVLGPVALQSRPYRIDSSGLATDVAYVRDQLKRRRLREAVVAYTGPVLPASTAPGIVNLRAALHSHVRSMVLTSTDADAVFAFADSPHGAEDYQVWLHAGRILGDGSPRRQDVLSRLAMLDARLA